MTLEEATLEVVRSLRDAGISHMLVGSLSSNFYGIPRNTKDADLVVETLNHAALNKVEATLGDAFEMDPQTSFETITGNQRNIIRLQGSPFVIELFELADDPFQQERFRRRVEIFVPQLNDSVFLPTAEDVIIQKLRWARPKDLEDVRDVVAVQSGHLDEEYISKWCHELEVTKLYLEIKESVSGI